MLMVRFEVYILLILFCYLVEFGFVFYFVKEKNFDDCGNRCVIDCEFFKKVELEIEMVR